MTTTVFAPGRVNLIGDHTDYMGGVVLPMAIQMGTTITSDPLPGRLRLRSDRVEGVLDIALPVTDTRAVVPGWGRYVAGVAAVLGATDGVDGVVTSDLPVGGGLSSSASLAVAAALALDSDGTPAEIAHRAQRAEVTATGVPCGIMDQLAVAAGVAGHALLIDCSTEDVSPIPLPATAGFWVVDSGQPRTLDGSPYAERRAQAEAAAGRVGPLPRASMAAIESLEDPLLRSRARHVRTECDRVHAAAASLAAGDLVRAGELMVESHRSLRDDFDVSTPVLDELVDELLDTPGVHGARLTGAGFGGCVVALADAGVALSGVRVRPSAGARVIGPPGSRPTVIPATHGLRD